LLTSLRKKIFDLKSSISNLNDFKVKSDYEYKLLRKSITGEKFDNDYHLSTCINISNNENESMLIVKNVTTNENIKFNNNFIIDSKTQNKFLYKDNIKMSNETPIYIEKTNKTLEDMFINKLYTADDNRFFIAKALYPQTLINDLIYKNDINYFLYKQNYNIINTVNYNPKEILLNKTIKFSEEKGNSISNNILKYNNFMLYLNDKSNLEDIQALERLDLINKLTKYKQYPLIELDKDNKIYNILTDQYIAQNKNAFIKINQDGDNICKLGENIIKKFS